MAEKRGAGSIPKGPKLKKARLCKYRKEWEKDYPVKASPTNSSMARCTVCSMDITIAGGGQADLLRHVKSERHKQKALLVKSNSTLFTKPTHFADSVTRAETMMTQFLVNHNISLATADHFSKFVGKAFPDSDIAKKISVKRTKATAIVKNALGPHYCKEVVETARTSPFTLMVDESNDNGDDKLLCIMLRIFDDNRGKVRSAFLDMPICNIPNAANLFDAIDKVIQSNKIPWENCIGFSSDTPNVMIGQRNSVLSRLRLATDQQVFSQGCVSHLAHLCAKSGIKAMDAPITELLIDVYYFLHGSSKRKEEYKEFQAFCDVESLKILKHVDTRWLSLEKCVKRFNEQWPALKSHFNSHRDVEKQGKVKRAAEGLGSGHLRLCYAFLEHALPVLNRFNTTFQAEESRVAKLVPECKRLLRTLLNHFVKPDVISATADSLSVNYHNPANQRANEDLVVGPQAQELLKEIEDDVSPAEIAKFHKSVRSYYIGVTDKIIKKFPFECPILNTVGILLPDNRMQHNCKTLEALVKRFKVLAELQDSASEEWIDYQVAIDLPTAEELDVFWDQIGKMKNIDGSPRFANLARVMKALLVLPYNQAAVERVFSIVKKTKTEFRSSMIPETLSALMCIKVNSEDCCFDFRASQSLLKKARSATNQ